MSDDWQQVFNGNNYSVPIKLFAADRSEKTILVLPALGVRVSFYTDFAQALQALNFNVVLVEQRGYGHSSIRASRRQDWGFKECIEEDLPAVIEWAQARFTGEFALLGHSLGGHIANCYVALNPDRISRLILPACGTPWYKAYEGRAKIQISVLTKLIPIMSAVFGFYNGKLMGFGGQEAKTLMSDWRWLAKYNRYLAHAVEANLDESLKSYSGHILSVCYREDELAPLNSIDTMLAKMPSASITRSVIDTATLGKKANHFNWAKKPEVTIDAMQKWW